jgi:hypothetical protein
VTYYFHFPCWVTDITVNIHMSFVGFDFCVEFESMQRKDKVRTMSKMRVAVIGSGISGLVSACVLAKAGVDVVLYEKEDYLGGHARTVNFDGVDLDLGFMVFNRVSCPFFQP